MNLFGGQVGAAMTYTAVHKLIGRIAARTGIGFTAHMLRHSHATDMIRQGVPIEVVARLLTHRSSTTTSQTYVHLDAADIRRSAAQGRGLAGGGPGDQPRASQARTAAAPGGQRRGEPSSTASGPQTTGMPGGWASPPGAGAARPASAGSASPGSAARSSAGPGSGWRPGARSPPSMPGRWHSPGSPGSSPRATRRPPTRARSPGRSWRTTCPGWSPRDTRRRTRALSLSMIRVFFDACHRHGWLPGLAAGATIYVEELPFHHDEIARFIPEFVMAQLESEQALAKIPHTTTRNLIVVLIETGLRGGDACNLPFNPVLDRQQRLALPAVRGRQGPRRAADPAQRQGRRRRSAPSKTRARALAGGQPLAVPRDRRQRRRLQALLAQHLHPAARALAARHRPARRGRAAGHRDRPPVPSHARDPTDQLRRPPACGAKAPRPCQPAHDQPLRQGPRRHHPGGVRPLPGPAGEHQRASGSATTPTPRPPRPNGSSTTSTASATASRTATAAARPSRTARTRTPA